MDFYHIKTRTTKDGILEVYPDFRVCRSNDLMIRGRAFYAIWDEEKGLWSTDEYDVQRLVDQDLLNFAEDLRKRNTHVVRVKLLSDFSSRVWVDFRNYASSLSDSHIQLDEKIVFANTEVKKEDYVSRKLPYPLAEGDISAYEELVSTLYDPEERDKLEWAIGSVIAGDSRHIQKFIVLYGAAGAGKSTFLNIVQKLFSGYYTTFEAKALTSSGNAFSTEVFKSNPLVAIQHDGDLSRIEDNTKLNSIVSHEEMTMNEKYKPSYMSRINAFLFMGTNKPVKITDSKSGIIRRLIDVQPSGRRVTARRYHVLYSQIDFELGAIAHHCLRKYRSMGQDYYSTYRPLEMMLQTDIFFNFIEANFDVFKEQDGTTLTQAYQMYKVYCEETLIEHKLPQYKFREELKNYFQKFEERSVVDGVRVRSWYSGFNKDKFSITLDESHPMPLVLEDTVSIFDQECARQPAQYAREPQGTPKNRWDEVETVLDDIDTTRLHYVRPPLNHIVIDFDLTNDDGEKDAQLNLEAANKWPQTYAEYSKGGSGIHLHYIYSGDPTALSRIYDEGIEIKVFNGHASLRRKLSKCNNIPIATLTGGLPLKEKKLFNAEKVKSEKSLRDLIFRNLAKEIHPGTKPSIDFIHKILEDAYSSDLSYDLTDLRPQVLAFANNSTNQSLYCVRLVQQMKFKSEETEPKQEKASDDRLVFFDVEVFPNLFVICWKYEGSDTVVRMVNPPAHEVEDFARMRLVGFNCRRYDNHILYGAIMGYNNEQLYRLSRKIISGSPSAYFGEAYGLSYADIYDYSSKKQSLKKFEVELGILHKELSFDWDKPIDEKHWDTVVDYCVNDVNATEAVYKDRIQDFIARQILSDISGLPVNATTQQHTAKIIFEGNRHPQQHFKYTKLEKMFPGYSYEAGKSTYRGEIVGEGGYVYAEPGMYENVTVLDVASMHPTSIEQLELFGPYTRNYSGLKAARLAIKHGDFEKAKKMLGGKLIPYLQDAKDAKALSHALKIVINIVYGLTSAKFENPFRDVRNVDNIVAKRGALFMIDLKNALQAKGVQVIHIKTDSIKLSNPSDEIVQFVLDFGKEYGYEFEVEATFSKFCLVNDAVYIGRKEDGDWEAVGAQFAHPYVFKTIFSKEPISFEDLCEERSVTTRMYLDFNTDETPMFLNEDLYFVGKTNVFCPILPDRGESGVLLREKDGKFYAVTGTKGYRWHVAEVIRDLNREDDIDRSYFDKLVTKARATLGKFGDVEWLCA